MNIILLSKSLNTDDISKMNTSSAKFEYSFAKNLAEKSSFNVNVLSFGLPYNIKLGNKKRNLVIVGLNGKDQKENFSNFENIMKTMECRDTILIYYGYDLLYQFNILKYRKKMKFKTIPFIFDSHQGAIENFRYIKRMVADLYFKTSILFLNKNDGFLLFNKLAVSELNVKKPYLITKPGIQVNDIYTTKYKRKNKKFVLLYTGTLIKYNGIIPLLEAFSEIKSPNFQLKIFGRGPLKNVVQQFSNNDRRIFYGGLVNTNELQKEYENADLLINMRDPDHYVTKYSFPSKLIEYISKGKPILSSDLNFDHNLNKGLYIVKDLSPQNIKQSIISIESISDEEKNKKIKMAQESILDGNNWNKLVRDLEIFIEKEVLKI